MSGMRLSKSLKRTLVGLALVIGIGAAGSAHAYWYPSDNGYWGPITDLVAYEGTMPTYMVGIGSGGHCYVQANEPHGKDLISIVMAAYLTGKVVNIHCYPQEENVAGFPCHRLHRIILPQ